MDPIERVSDAVAALVGRDMTREDCHQFILEAAQMMEEYAAKAMMVQFIKPMTEE